MEPVYELDRVKKVYGSRTVLNIGRLDVFPGEVLVIVGPSGAGKSTLLRLLNFLEAADEGTIRYNQKPISPATIPLDIRRGITTVFQQPALLTASVQSNLKFGLSLRGLHNSRDEIENLLDQMGLTVLRTAPAHTLSGGEAQRVALARAIILKPAVLLLDEPTANLDPYNVELIETSIRRLNQDHQTTIVMVTHNVFQARRLADRAALLLNGEIVETGAVPAFFDEPTEHRTRAFLRGEMVW